MNNREGLNISARFAIPASPTCRPGEPTFDLVSCATKGECAGIEQQLMTFPTMYPYLLTIAEVTGVEPFSEEAVRTYWLGSDLLTSFGSEHFSILLDQMRARGVSPVVLQAMEQARPDFFLPLHLYQVALVQDGYRVPLGGSTALDGVNNCMIRWGRVLDLQGNGEASTGATLELNGLEKSTSGIVVAKQHVSMPLNNDYVVGIKPDDMVSVHLGLVNKILTPEEVESVSHWTQKVVDHLAL